MFIFKLIIRRIIIVNFHGSHYNPGCEVSCAVIINDIISCNNTITDISIQKNCAVTIIRNRIVSDCEILVFTHHNQSLIKSIGNGTVFDCKCIASDNINTVLITARCQIQVIQCKIRTVFCNYCLCHAVIRASCKCNSCCIQRNTGFHADWFIHPYRTALNCNICIRTLCNQGI